MRSAKQTLSGVTLIELLCVIAIIMILIGLLLGPVSRAYHRAKGLADEVAGR